MLNSVNQIRVELQEVANAHLQINDYFWGDFLRAYKENTELNYPLMGVFYPSATLLNNQTQLALTIYICDRVYKDYSNLNDVESDTLQICRDIYQVINGSQRWRRLGRVTSASATKFIERGGDEVAGHTLTINFLLRDQSGICDLPMEGYDFDMEVGASCAPVEIYENGVLVATIASGGSYSYTHEDANYIIRNDAGGILYQGTIAEGATLDQTIQDSTVTITDDSANVLHTVSVNAEGSATQVISDSTVTITDDSANVLHTLSVNAQGTATQVITDSTVANSDASYSASVNAEGSLVLPDSTVNVNSVNEGSVVSVKAIDINVTDGASPVTPDSVSVLGNTVTIAVPAATPAPVGATLMKTGQTVSYRNGDDGFYEAGRATNFFTLASNNPFGNTNRFTDELGGQTYTNNIVIDWSTYDGSTVLGYRRTTNGSNVTWENAIDGALAVSIGSFTSGWRLPNKREIENIQNLGLASSDVLNYSPFNLSTTTIWLWCSNTLGLNNLYSWRLGVYGACEYQLKSNASRYIPVRTFTVTGTILS